MKALKGQIPRPPGDCRMLAQRPYLEYVRAVAARLGPLEADARLWLREAGLLALSLDQLATDVQRTREALENGAGRRARATAKVDLRRLERRQARQRAALQAAEHRLAELAGPPSLDGLTALQRHLTDRYGERGA